MEKEFIQYEEALTLKELGFNEDGFGMFMDGDFIPGIILYKQIKKMESTPISKKRGTIVSIAPLYQQAFDWLEERCYYNISYETYTTSDDVRHYVYEISGGICRYDTTDKKVGKLKFLKKLIETVKNKNHGKK